jgi:glycosyltransferase involved in cell wall biosynthesis
MKIGIFLNELSVGGTEKAACTWASLLRRLRGHQVKVFSISDGPRRADVERAGIPLHILGIKVSPTDLADQIEGFDVVHAHAPGFPHQGDILGKALASLRRTMPVVQTNIFGKLENPEEKKWINFRLFISWTSSVQAARRAGKRLDLEFFRRQSVASYPVFRPEEGEISELSRRSRELRTVLGVEEDQILLGRFSRPEPNKWTSMVLESFLEARRRNSRILLLLREPPPKVAARLINEGIATRWDAFAAKLPKRPILMLPSTADAQELVCSQMACDVILHTSSIGESFGYGIAEPMALGKPVITNSVPWHDQAQIELVRHRECGLIASTVGEMKSAILLISQSEILRREMGHNAKNHILRLADPVESINRVETAMQCALEDRENPFAAEDLEMALKTAEFLDRHQWGNSLKERYWLRGNDFKIRFLRWQNKLRGKLNK